MSKKIEVGMLCMIVDRVPGVCSPNAIKYLGTIHRTEEKRPSGAWRMEGIHDLGLGGNRLVFPEGDLIPINPDNEPSTWEEVQALTNWNPTKVMA